MASTQAPPASTPKTMSSRLLTMKFMQRAAASSPSPDIPHSSHSAKRQKLSNGIPSPVTPSADAAAIQAALAAEEAKHQAVLDRQRLASQETKWVLSCLVEKKDNHQGGARPDIASIGYGDIDARLGHESEVGELWRPAMVGRRSFGKFNRRLEPYHVDNFLFQHSDSEKEISSSQGSNDDMEHDQDAADRSYAADREASTRTKLELQAKQSRKGGKPRDRTRGGEGTNMNRKSSISTGGAEKRGRARDTRHPGRTRQS